MTLNDLHSRLNRQVKAIFANEVTTADDREWRLTALREAYADFGNRSDAVRGLDRMTLHTNPYMGE